jgi:hypothetical protein
MRYPLQPRRDDRRLVREDGFRLRLLTAPLRALPHFLIVGAMKSGTSSLFHCIRQHPMVASPFRKEVHYFSHGVRHGRGDGWYRAHFPLRMRLRPGTLTGEATPDYMFDREAVAGLAARLPRARLIVILRDPVERAISHYFHECRMGREYLPLEQALAVEDERLEAARHLGEAGVETLMHASYKARGRYAEQLETLRRHVPPERILVLGSATLFRTPERALGEVFDFLGLPPPPSPPRLEVKNAGTNRTEVSDAVREGLAETFRDDNERLFALLGRKLDW